MPKILIVHLCSRDSLAAKDYIGHWCDFSRSRQQRDVTAGIGGMTMT